MATADMEDTPDLSDEESSSEAGSEEQPDLMVTTRERRKTAGNRYTATVAQEQADIDEDDDVALLFAEGEGEDEEYNSDEDGDDADMSSSDDDDQGPNAAADDMEGEKEIERQAKAERAKKRKADMALTSMAGIQKKKVKIDPTALHRAPERPKPSKKKERTTWLPETDAASGRSSLRKQTVAHRQETHARLKESEELRLKLKAQREKKEQQRMANAPKELTQADRLAEAERIEKRNAKSLNRWETMEKQRAEERAAKLAALKNRKLDGAVITFHSSKHTYIGPKVERLSPGPSDGVVELKKRGRKPKAYHEQMALSSQASTPLGTGSNTPINFSSQHIPRPPLLMPVSLAPLPQPNAAASIQYLKSEPGSTGLLSGIQEYASTPKMPSASIAPLVPAATLPTTHEPPNHNVSYQPALDGVAVQTESTTLEQAPQEARDDARLHASQQTPIRVTSPSAMTNMTVEPVSTSQPALMNQPTTTQATAGPSAQQSTSTFTLPEGVSPAIIPSAADNHPPQRLEAKALPQTALSPIITQIGQPQDQVTPGVHTMTPMTAVAAPAATPMSIDRPATIPLLSGPKPPITTPIRPLLPQSVSNASESHSAEPEQPIIEVTSTRNLVILQDWEELAANAKDAFKILENSKKATKVAKQGQELCPISGLTARYRDPATGIPYANMTAYKKLKQLKEHQFVWSSMLGCYTGRAQHVARGVPEGFIQASV